MAQLVTPIFGRGTSGNTTFSSSIQANPWTTSFTGSTGSLSGSGTHANFAAGQMCFIHQSINGNYGYGERNIIVGYSAGTIQFAVPLSYTYTSGAQIIILSEYSSIGIAGGVTLTGPDWNGSTGGILPLACNGTLTIDATGALRVDGRSPGTSTTQAGGGGYRGGQYVGLNNHDNAYAGEGYSGFGGQAYTNGQACNPVNNGGAGGAYGSSPAGAGSGGGGSNGTQGTNGVTNGGGDYGRAGLVAGSVDLVRMVFGGGGGSAAGGDNSDGGIGGNGGGIIIIWARNIVVNGALSANGGNGGTATTGTNKPGGGAGAGGSILLICESISGLANITALGGTGGGSTYPGGNGGAGRIAIARCRITGAGTTNPNYYDRGYQTYCGVVGRG